MPAVIRLKRFGTLKKPFHRIVVIDKRRARDSEPIETLGYYDPKTNPANVKLNKERAEYWLGVGAAPSDAVKLLFKKHGIKKVKA
ncbi:MAG: 30S ribosomal protein S16 [Omnitrophica bacterium RIFCSPLOWO2_01_FULL_45_24]|nr:MAG: 30S ribosomal protein S16 [Omnitrophica bacterium RIFCSPLOWO2_01_FULL_45_24]